MLVKCTSIDVRSFSRQRNCFRRTKHLLVVCSVSLAVRDFHMFITQFSLTQVIVALFGARGKKSIVQS